LVNSPKYRKSGDFKQDMNGGRATYSLESYRLVNIFSCVLWASILRNAAKDENETGSKKSYFLKVQLH
jgi:hypothetical protein